MSVLMELNKIIMRESVDSQIIVLREVRGDRRFSIVIGSEVAAAIHRRLKGQIASRPMTHDLLAEAITQLGGTVDRIEIVDLQEHTYIARIILKQGDREISLDSRPSDAIAVGIAGSVPIHVAEHVLAAACE
jgi:bifunctional DNase/RNase